MILKHILRYLIFLIDSFLSIVKLKCRFLLNLGILNQQTKFLNPECIEIGKNVRIKKNARIECYKTFSNIALMPKLILEDGVIIGPNFTGLIANLVVIKKNTILAGNVTLVSENHGIDPESELPYHAQPLETASIHIGEGCWIGQNVTVLPGVNIGDKVVVAAGAVVSHDIPSYTIAAGVPAKVIKKYNFLTHRWEKYEK